MESVTHLNTNAYFTIRINNPTNNQPTTVGLSEHYVEKYFKDSVLEHKTTETPESVFAIFKGAKELYEKKRAAGKGSFDPSENVYRICNKRGEIKMTWSTSLNMPVVAKERAPKDLRQKIPQMFAIINEDIENFTNELNSKKQIVDEIAIKCSCIIREQITLFTKIKEIEKECTELEAEFDSSHNSSNGSSLHPSFNRYNELLGERVSIAALLTSQTEQLESYTKEQTQLIAKMETLVQSIKALSTARSKLLQIQSTRS